MNVPPTEQKNDPETQFWLVALLYDGSEISFHCIVEFDSPPTDEDKMIMRIMLKESDDELFRHYAEEFHIMQIPSVIAHHVIKESNPPKMESGHYFG